MQWGSSWRGDCRWPEILLVKPQTVAGGAMRVFCVASLRVVWCKEGWSLPVMAQREGGPEGIWRELQGCGYSSWRLEWVRQGGEHGVRMLRE